MPTVGGEDMLVTIELEDNTFVRKTEYIGTKEKPLEEKGSYTWNMDGKRITGDLADMYVLRKQ